MPVRKKKKSQVNRQKTALAQHQNQFISEAKDIIAKAAGPDVVRLIPDFEFEHLYKTRLHPVRVKAGQGETMPKDILEYINHLVTLFFKTGEYQLK